MFILFLDLQLLSAVYTRICTFGTTIKRTYTQGRGMVVGNKTPKGLRRAEKQGYYRTRYWLIRF
jgi:hypothetical protein